MQKSPRKNQKTPVPVVDVCPLKNRFSTVNVFLIKAFMSVIFLAGCIFSNQHAFANENVTGIDYAKTTLIYISPSDYNYSVRLLHPFFDYWFEQGPLVEPVVLSAFEVAGKNVTMCKSNEIADEIIRIKPNLFYNPLLRVFYSSLLATVFSSTGEQLATYKGEGQQNGFMAINHATSMHLSKAYKTAMDNLMQNMAAGKTADKKSAKTNAQVVAADAKNLPCGLIGQQPEPRFSFY